MDGFEGFMRTATGHAPHPYQARLAAEGLPELLSAPTGAGKSAAAVLAWLYRRLIAAPESTPRRLVYVLPQHSLPDQLHDRIGQWLARLGRADEVGLHPITDGAWRRRPERTAILVGTHDLLLSRALMRGYGDATALAPVSYALLHTDTQWVVDEADLLGPALPTTVALQRLRDEVGTPSPTGTMWMSSDASLPSVRRITRLDIDPAHYIEGLADALAAAHVPGTQTIAVLNTVERARALYAALRETGRDVLLVHPRFRAVDRRRLLSELDDTGHDRIVVTAQALEAGIDVSSRTLLTELAPLSSIVQRAGRCNRYGEHPAGGDLLWCEPSTGADPDTARWLLAPDRPPVRPATPDRPALRLPDLLELFDTAEPDTDVSRWICDRADLTVSVAWRDGEPSEDEPGPGRDELCQVPLADLEQRDHAWVRDRSDGHWRRVAAGDLQPGATVLLQAEHGGYLPDEGWAPESRTPVTPLALPPSTLTFACTRWVSLDQHLMETEQEARLLLDALPGLPAEQQEAVARAARYHDLGKCHEVFQEMLRAGGGDFPEGLLAKSRAPYNTGRHRRAHFRHELVSALILPDGQPLINYLVAAHHGKVRITVRPAAGEETPFLMGVRDGDRTPPIELSTGERFPAQSLRTDIFTTGPWTERAKALRDDLGPFRLAYLETLVRVADWRSSARHDGPVLP
ncbi:CRISPR-associated endonuclease Cas3'' [Catellatospora sp. TT07R-123]|uniref:CRISPR-associated endonuclease Cas3'' n=1 Tax=Catellatospora sp. TT07R-123 TaxID=2733863 RepID=UPI001BB3D5BF|nr:CRISPR-associated endonuclease Cas3'' [Catellatospora sp. TT07R-123]